jgi:branched-chain amino acid transport system ATP-binding protein
MVGMSAAILEVEGVSLQFGGVLAVDNVSLTVQEKEVYALIGPNGAGKTSLLNCINGFYRPQSGSVRFRGRELVGMRPHKIAALGIGRAFQNIELFRGITVLENLLMGRHLHMKRGPIWDAIYVGPSSREEVANRARVEEVIDLLEIGAFRKQLVGNLSYGKQKLVEIGRALALEPDLLLLDEPAAGMNRDEKEDVARFIMRIRHEVGITQVLIEHDVRFVSDLSDRVTVLHLGRKIAEGNPEQVFRQRAVMDAYVGTGGAPGEDAAQEARS